MDFDAKFYVTLIAALYLFFIFFENLKSVFSKSASYTYATGVTLGNVVL